MTMPPTVDEVLDYMRVQSADESERAQVESALNAALEDQAALCHVGNYTDALHWAALRRTARSLAARSVPLGILTDLGEFGSASLRGWDAEIEQYEAPHRKMVVA